MSKSPCKSCGATDYFYWRLIAGEWGKYEECSGCSKGKVPGLSPDVYFDSSKGANQTDPNLHDRYTGAIPFSSKREKKAVLNRLGLQEDGDKKHGARNFDKTSSKQWEGMK